MLKYFLGRLRLFVFYHSFLLAYRNGKILPPKYVTWDCSRKCNFNCEHCGAKKEKYDTELSRQQAKDFIKYIQEYGTEYFVVTGGEPLLRQDIFEIFEYAKEVGLRTGIATNAFFIDENNAGKIARVFDSIQISLDGTKETHNKIRRNDKSYDKIIKAVGLLKKNAKQITIASVITRSNLNEFEALADIVTKKLKPNIWKVTVMMPIGNAETNKFLYLGKKEIKRLFDLIEKYKKEIHIEMGDNLGYLGKYEKKLRTAPFFCPVGFLTCCLGVDGNIRGCPEEPDTDEFIEGNILKDDLKEIWEKGFIKYRENEILNEEKCSKCKDKNICRGGCWVMRTQGQNCTKDIYKL